MAVYLGIDINKKYTQISYWDTSGEPLTLSQTGKEGVYAIPVCICKKKGDGEWLCGFDAKGHSDNPEYSGVWELFDSALSDRHVIIDEEDISCRLLYALYIQKLIMIASSRFGFKNADKIIFTSYDLKQQLISMMDVVSDYLPVPKEKILLKSYKETFYYYALKQKPEFKHNGIMLYHYEDDRLCLFRLERNERSVPKVVSVKEEVHERFAVGLLGKRKKDEETDLLFDEIVNNDLNGRQVSVIYLVGDGFDGGWMDKSARSIVKGRHAFVGKNLYSRGACYGCGIAEASAQWPYIYLGDSKTKVNILLEVLNKGRNEVLTLISAGENWYETSSRHDVILSEGNEFDIILMAPDGSEKRRQSIALSGLKNPDDRTMRLEIYARPESENEVYLKITDKGFGDIHPSSGQVFEYRITV